MLASWQPLKALQGCHPGNRDKLFPSPHHILKTFTEPHINMNLHQNVIMQNKWYYL